jgi:hypothetical protein
MPGGQGDVLAVLLPENGVLREWHEVSLWALAVPTADAVLAEV